MKNIKLIICIVLISYFIITSVYFANKIFNYIFEKKTVQTTWLHLSRKSHFALLPSQKNKKETIFLGASIIQYCEWNELLGYPNIRNRGIAGDTTQDILTRINEIINRKPAQLFIMIGLNDIMEGKSLTSMKKSFKNILETCSAQSPHTTIYILSILPVNKRITNSTKLNKIISKTNKAHRMTALQLGHKFIDLNKTLQNENHFLRGSYTIDGIHLNGSGYQKIREHILPYINNTVPNDMRKEL
jgi:lysophospholipase L1-like esterase